MQEIQLIANKRRLNYERTSKFTGNDFVKKGLSGKDVGIAIKRFQDYITKNFQTEFDVWLDNSDKEHVTNMFEQFCEEFYKK
jgi:hypothetical protein